VKDPGSRILDLLKKTYDRLSSVRSNVRIIVTTYFEHSSEATAVLSETGVWGLGLDFGDGKNNL
jgi:5-methyltetrahydropteroyltriglutamate--homocysteine methyltransferase